MKEQGRRDERSPNPNLPMPSDPSAPNTQYQIHTNQRDLQEQRGWQHNHRSWNFSSGLFCLYITVCRRLSRPSQVSVEGGPVCLPPFTVNWHCVWRGRAFREEEEIQKHGDDHKELENNTHRGRCDVTFCSQPFLHVAQYEWISQTQQFVCVIIIIFFMTYLFSFFTVCVYGYIIILITPSTSYSFVKHLRKNRCCSGSS